MERDRFQTTRWDLIAAARREPDALARVLDLYWPPVYAFLRRQGLSPERAGDLTQGFFCDVVLSRDLIAKADSSRGRFRSLVLTALQHYRIDDERRAKPERSLLSLSESDLANAEPNDDDDPQAAFDRAWTASEINEAIAIVRDEFALRGKASVWEAIYLALIEPARNGCDRPKVADIAATFGLTPPQLSREIYKAKQMIRQRLGEMGQHDEPGAQSWPSTPPGDAR